MFRLRAALFPLTLLALALPLAAATRALTANLPRVAEARAADRPLVVIDAGHGGRDPGAQSPVAGVDEKHVALAIAKAIRDELVRSGRVRVAMTREDDRYLSLEQRVAVARRLRAALFIAVHADSAPNPLARGATLYTLSEVASSAEAARFAARENAALAIADLDLARTSDQVRPILIDLVQRETMDISAEFARTLQREARREVLFRDNFHQFGAFVVLKAADTPAVLLESGYLTNVDDAAILLAPEGRRRIASGVARAVELHLARRRVARR